MLLEEARGSDRAVSVAEGIITHLCTPFLSKDSLPTAQAPEAQWLWLSMEPTLGPLLSPALRQGQPGRNTSHRGCSL